MTTRDGFVRSNSGGVYKGIEARNHYSVEYQNQKDYSKVIMFVVIPLVLVGMYVLLTSIS